jgi:hypothetical protein
LAAGGPLSALDGVPAQDIEWLAVRVYRWLVNAHRKLVTGITLAELAGDDLPQYEDDAELRLGGFAKQAADRAAQFGLARTAAHGALACPHWWGHPRWPDLVDRLLIVLDDPANEHWGQGGELRRRLPAEPPIVADRKLLRRVLRRRPWDLSSEAAGWLVNAVSATCGHQRATRQEAEGHPRRRASVLPSVIVVPGRQRGTSSPRQMGHARGAT